MIKCSNCGNEIREGTKFCSKCGSNILEQQEKRNDEISNEEKNKVEQSKAAFYFEKVKMIGRLRYRIIQTKVNNDGDGLEINQKTHRFLRKDKANHLEIKLSEISSMELKTKMDFWDTMYAALFGVIFLLDTTDIAWLLLIAIFLYTGYGKILNLKMKNGLNFEIPVNGMTEDVERFRALVRKE